MKLHIKESFSRQDLELAIQKFANENSNKDIDKIKKRIAFIGEFDNGHVLHGDWLRIPAIQAELLAQEKSSTYKDKVFYVVYDDIMIGSSDLRWKGGEFRSVYDKEDKPTKNSEDNKLRYSKENILNACEFAGLVLVQEYPNGKLRFFKDGKFEYFYDWADLIDFLEHYNRYFDNVRTEDIINILNNGMNESVIKMNESYLYPDETKEDAKEDAYAIHKRHDIFTYSEIERFLHGHSDRYINMVIDYIEDLDVGIDIFSKY